MKKINAFIFVTLFVIAVSSCHKEEQGKTITKTINVTIATDESYSNQIPHQGDADDMWQITKQAINYSVSRLTSSASSDNTTFEFAPSTDFTGTDEVVVSTFEDQQNNGGGGKCKGGNQHQDDTYVYIFKFTVTGSTK